jgi:hypothetical protein
MPKHYADTTRNPDTMTADERRDEVAGILARGLVRALEAKHTADIGDRRGPRPATHPHCLTPQRQHDPATLGPAA